MKYDGYLSDNIPLLISYAISRGQTEVIASLADVGGMSFEDYKLALNLATQCREHEITAILLDYGNKKGF